MAQQFTRGVVQVHHFIYKPGGIVKAWAKPWEGFTLNAGVKYTGTEQLKPLTVPFYPSGTILLFQASSKDAKLTCTENNTYIEPVVFVYREYVQLFHWLYEQLLPFALLLAEFGLEHSQVQIIALNGPNYQNWRLEHGGSIADEWSFITGFEPVDWGSEKHEPFCANIALLGNAGRMAVQYDTKMTTEDLMLQRPKLRWFVRWLLSKYQVEHSPSSLEKLRLSIIHRPLAKLRDFVNADEILQHANAAGFNATLYDFEGVSFGDQLQIMATTDILLTVHGAAHAGLIFLPPWAVAIEVKAYGHGSDKVPDFGVGVCNWARLSSTSFIVWHNTDKSNSRAGPNGWSDFKNHDTYLTQFELTVVLNTAAHVVNMPLEERDFDECIILNEPVQPESFNTTDVESTFISTKPYASG